MQAREQLDDGDKFRSYLFSIAYNTLRSHLRKKQTHGHAIDFESVSIHSLSPGPSSLVARKRELRLLLAGLRRIPVADQVVLELHYWEDLSTAEIGAVLGRSRNTVKGQLKRARDHLEAEMARLTQSAELLQSTLSNLAGWAAEIRARMDRGKAPDSP